MTVAVLGVILIASMRLHGIPSRETAIFVMPFVDIHSGALLSGGSLIIAFFLVQCKSVSIQNP
jgi:hypothetical protein